MADSDKKVTFELKDLTYDELLSSYLEVCEFLTFLNDSKVAIKGATGSGDSILKSNSEAEETPEAENTTEPPKEGEAS